MTGTLSDPKIGIALGGGAARGLAHVAFIEAMDELGVKPSIVAGTSIGALIGSGWAAGLTGSDIRDFAFEALGSMNGMFGRLFARRRLSLRGLFERGLSMQLDPEEVVEAFTPPFMPARFEDLALNFHAVATDFRGWNQVVFNSGPLFRTVAASLAIPSIFRPVAMEGTLMVDGGVVNPLPLDIAAPGSDILIGIDVNGDPGHWPDGYSPAPLDIGLGSMQIAMQQLIAHAIAAYPPDLYFRPRLQQYGPYEFWRVREIIAAGNADKERFKRRLAERIESFIAARQKTF